MKQYVVILDDELSDIYKEIVKTCSNSTETVLQDTLFKVMDIIRKKTNEE